MILVILSSSSKNFVIFGARKKGLEFEFIPLWPGPLVSHPFPLPPRPLARPLGSRGGGAPPPAAIGQRGRLPQHPRRPLASLIPFSAGPFPFAQTLATISFLLHHCRPPRAPCHLRFVVSGWPPFNYPRRDPLLTFLLRFGRSPGPFLSCRVPLLELFTRRRMTSPDRLHAAVPPRPGCR